MEYFVCEVVFKGISANRETVLISEDGGEPEWHPCMGGIQSFHPTKASALKHLSTKALERARRIDREAREAWVFADQLTTERIKEESKKT